MQVQEYQRKALTVKAIQVSRGSVRDAAKWCVGQVIEADGKFYVSVDTPEGVIYARTGDWIVLGERDSFFVCSDPMFRLLYEPFSRRIVPTVRVSGRKCVPVSDVQNL